MKTSWKQYLRDYLMITAGCLIYAFSFNCFFNSSNLAMGGFTGLAQVLNRLMPFLPIGTTVFCMNVPLMILGVRKEGWNLLFASVYATFVSSVFIDLMDFFIPFPPMEPLLACLYGGVILGVSLGIMMRKSATTGGTELAARLLRYRFTGISIGKICLVIDVSVIIAYALTFRSAQGLNNALYGIISMYVSSVVMDMVVYGAVNAKLAYIVSDRVEDIRKKLMDMGLGGTFLQGRGAYTDTRKDVLLCAARPAKLGKIKAAVREVDPDNAFVIVTDAREVLGEGFGEIPPLTYNGKGGQF